MKRISVLILLIVSLPILSVLYILVKTNDKGPFLFKQKRVGKNKKVFTIYKIRTMVTNAEELKKRYLKLNEVNGPVFKIRNDPRYTKIGKIIAHSGLDELPQLINVIKGNMALVGPRPLPLEEALKIPKKYQARFSVLPGITSPWVVKGSHKMSFDEWMKLDLQYIKQRSLFYDLKIILQTIQMTLTMLIFKILSQDA